MKDVTLIITSCGRFDLLEQTLDSFFKKNTYTIKEIIIVEDSTEGLKLRKLINKYKYDNFNLIVNENRLGQLKSIDIAYNKVKTEYVFHCEDDWEFLKSGFIEKSIEILDNDPKILIVGLRSIDDYEYGYFLNKDYISKTGGRFYEIKEEIFTYNPGLRRKSDHDLFGLHEQLENKLYEIELSKFYKNKGYRTVLLKDKYVEHIGYKRHIHFSKKGKNTVLKFKFDRMIKNIRYNILKRIGKI